MNINFSGYRENVITFECNENVAVGELVRMESSGKVRNCSDGESFIGVAVAVRDGYAAVQLEGYVEVKKNGNIYVGYRELAAAKSGVKCSVSGCISRLVIYVDDTKVGFIL